MLFPKDSNIRLLGVFQALDTFSELLAFFATGLVAYDRTHSTLVVSAVMTAVALAEAGGALLGGAFADRFDRKRVALMAAVAAGCLLMVLALGTNLIALTAVMVGMTIAAAPIRPAVFAALPNLLVEDELDTANSYLQTLRQGAFALSPIVAGFGAALIGASGLFVCAATMFGVAAIVLLCVRGRFHEDATPEAEETRFSPLAGVQLIRRDRVLSLLIGANLVSILTAAWATVADLPFAKEELHAGSIGYGILVAAWGAGAMAGATLAPLVIRRGGAAVIFAVALLLEGLGIGFATGAPTLIAGVLAFIAGGIGSGWLNVADSLLIAERTPDAVRGRVRAASDAAGSIAYTVSLGLGGPLVALAGARGTYLISGIGCVVSGLIAVYGLRLVDRAEPDTV
jgi:MFS family permease